MEWLEPKTDWQASEDEPGNYTGDYFNIEDYNRIKNNIEFLGSLAHQYWPVFVKAMPDHSYEEYPYAEEVNTLADNLEKINQYIGCIIGEKTTYVANGAFIGYADLNRLESACLSLYEAMQGLYTRPKKLPYRLGGGYYPLKDPRIPHRKLRLPFRLGTRLGGTYYPLEAPKTPPEFKTEQKRMPFRLGGEYFPFKE